MMIGYIYILNKDEKITEKESRKGNYEEMSNKNNEIEDISKKEKTIRKKTKIRQLINDGNFAAILSLLSKEDRSDFVEVITESLDERNSKLFWRKLEEYSAETLSEAEQRRIFEDVQATIASEDLMRSKMNESLRNGMTGQIEDLKKKNTNNEYLTVGDRHFLEDYDEDAFIISEQKRKNNTREERFSTMSELGEINAKGKNSVNRSRIMDSINRLIREKLEFISRGGDLNNSSIDYDKQIEQLYQTLEDTKKLDSTLQGISHKLGKEVRTEILDSHLEDETESEIENELKNLYKSTEKEEM